MSVERSFLRYPERLSRQRAALPIWFPRDLFREDSRFTVSLVESAGENFDDLLAAFWLALQDSDMVGDVSVVIADDQRDPESAKELASAAVSAGIDAVIGHFGSRTACAVADIYRAANVPFFAPGSSSVELCRVGVAPVFQVFAQDDGQVQSLAKHLAMQKGTLNILSEKSNAGETLGRLLFNVLATSGICAKFELVGISLDRNVMAAHACGFAPGVVALLGSKEFAAQWLCCMTHTDVEVILSDDAYGMSLVVERPMRGVSVCFPSTVRAKTFDQDTAKLDARGRVLRAKMAGPYFHTSYLSARLVLNGLRKGITGTVDFLGLLRSQQWESPYGVLAFDASGKSSGMSWGLHPISQ